MKGKRKTDTTSSTKTTPANNRAVRPGCSVYCWHSTLHKTSKNRDLLASETTDHHRDRHYNAMLQTPEPEPAPSEFREQKENLSTTCCLATNTNLLCNKSKNQMQVNMYLNIYFQNTSIPYLKREKTQSYSIDTKDLTELPIPCIISDEMGRLLTVKAKVTCFREPTEKTNASWLHVLSSSTGYPTHLTHTLAYLLLRQHHAKHTTLGLWSYRETENLNFSISWLGQAGWLGELS